MCKKRIMFISETVGGGLRKHLITLLKHLSSETYEIILIHGPRVDATFTKEKEKCENIHFVEISEFCREMNVKKDIYTFNKIRKEIQIFHPDIVHCHSSKAGILGRLAARISGVRKIFYTPHGYSFQADEFSSLQKKIFIFAERIVSRLATTKIFTVSKGERELAIAKHIDVEEKFQIIYNGLPPMSDQHSNRLHNLLGIDSSVKLFGNCARLSDEKNVPLFIEIAKEYLRYNMNAHFVWIGDGNHLKDYQNIHPNIHFIGYRNDADILISEFDGMLFTSKHEGLPYSLIEALRSGVPIVATDVPGNNEVVIPGINGYLFSSQNVTEGAQLLNKVSSISKDYIKKDFTERFSLDTMLEAIEQNYLN